jgi:hypothetical protein
MKETLHLHPYLLVIYVYDKVDIMGHNRVVDSEFSVKAGVGLC